MSGIERLLHVLLKQKEGVAELLLSLLLRHLGALHRLCCEFDARRVTVLERKEWSVREWEMGNECSERLIGTMAAVPSYNSNYNGRLVVHPDTTPLNLTSHQLSRTGDASLGGVAHTVLSRHSRARCQS